MAGKGKKATTTDDTQKKTKRQRSLLLITPLNILKMALSGLKSWSSQETNGLKDFFAAQAKVAVVLAVAHFGNIYEPAYPRNDNHAPSMFWAVNAILLVLTLATWSHKPSVGRNGGAPRVVMLGREQTEEWKGWMQWGFIFYHYYRVYYVYNEIRVFVSAYVWMVSAFIACALWGWATTTANPIILTYSYIIFDRLDSATSSTLTKKPTSPSNVSSL
jgi:hypothetical protein